VCGQISTVVPKELDPSWDAFTIFAEIIKDYCDTIEDGLNRDCILVYYGIRNDDKNLREIGQEHTVSRERVRQVRNIHLNKLKKLFGGHSINNLRCDVIVLQQIHALRDVFFRHMVFNDDFIKKVFEEEHIPLTADKKKNLSLFFEIFGIEYHPFFLTPIYFTRPIGSHIKIRKLYYSVKRIFRKNYLFVNINDLIRRFKVPKVLLQDILGLIPEIERIDSDRYQLADRASSGSDVAYRILTRIKTDMEYTELLEAVNKLRGSDIKTLPLSLDIRFKPIGKTGRWAARETDIDTDPMYVVIKRFLINSGRPCSLKEIYDNLRSVYPDVELKNVISLISVFIGKEFFRLKDHRVILKSWKGRYKNRINTYKFNRSKINVHQALIKIMKNKVWEPHQLINKLVAVTGLKRSSCHAVLSKSPIVTRHRNSNRKRYLYKLKDNYKSLIPVRKRVQRNLLNAIKRLFKDEKKEMLKRIYIVKKIKEKYDISVPYVYKTIRECDSFSVNIVDKLNTEVTLKD
jgi:hypothetical protein